MFTIPESLKPSKIYFPKNPISDMQLDRLKVLLAWVEAFNKSVKDNKLVEIEANRDEDGIIAKSRAHLIELSDTKSNKTVSEHFF